MAQSIFGYRMEVVLYDDGGKRLFIKHPLVNDGTVGNGGLNIDHISTCIDVAMQTRSWGPRPASEVDGGEWRVER